MEKEKAREREGGGRELLGETEINRQKGRDREKGERGHDTLPGLLESEDVMYHTPHEIQTALTNARKIHLLALVLFVHGAYPTFLTVHKTNTCPMFLRGYSSIRRILVPRFHEGIRPRTSPCPKNRPSSQRIRIRNGRALVLKPTTKPTNTSTCSYSYSCGVRCAYHSR